MFVTDIRKDFFDLLQKQNERILLVTNIDVDSVCAVKILQTLLQCDNIEYTLVPIQGKSDLIKAFEDNTGEDSGVNYVVLINCGATMDLEDFLHPHKDLVIFVADSHRPIGKLLFGSDLYINMIQCKNYFTEVSNVYNDGQIRLIMKPENDEDIPEFEAIFRDDSEGEESHSNSDDDENDDYGNKKKKRFDESAILKRRDRRLWEEQRRKILFDYEQFSYIGKLCS